MFELTNDSSCCEIKKIIPAKEEFEIYKFPVPEGVHSKEVDFFPYK